MINGKGSSQYGNDLPVKCFLGTFWSAPYVRVMGNSPRIPEISEGEWAQTPERLERKGLLTTRAGPPEVVTTVREGESTKCCGDGTNLQRHRNDHD